MRSRHPKGLMPSQEDDYIFSTLALLWRRSTTIVGFCLVTVIISALVTSFVQKRYTADAIIQAKFTSDKQQAQSGIALNAASMIATDAQLIKSRPIAERVVARLDLVNDAAFLPRKSLISRVRDLLSSVWPYSDKLPSQSKESLIADELLTNLKVTNDVRSYLIKISYTSTSPERSAWIANAFAKEYILTRIELSSRQKLADLVATYGPKHPKILIAKAELDQAIRSNTGENAQLLIPAEPLPSPSSPNWLLILGLVFVGSLVVGSFVVLIPELAASRR
jgi:polysaccharide biosynthesis transport protein